MKRNKQLVVSLLGLLISTTTLNAQILNEKFGNGYSWTAYGNQTLSPSGSNPGSLQVTNNQLEFRGFKGSQNYRLIRPIGSNTETNQATQYTKTFSSSDTWRMRFELKVVTSNQDNLIVFGLSDKTDHYLRDNNGDPLNTTNSIHMLCYDPLGSNNQLELRVRSKYGTQRKPISMPIYINPGTTYYVEIYRSQANMGHLGVFYDSDYTIPVSNTYVSFQIDPNLGGLQYVHASTSTGSGPQRIGDANIDNVEIIQIDNLNCDVYANYLLMGSTTNQKKFYNRSVVGSTEQTYLGSVIDFDDATFQKVTPGSGIVYHSYRYNSFFTPSMTSFSYYKSGGNYYLCKDEASGNGGFFNQSTIADDATDLFNGSTPNTYDNCNSMNPNFSYSVCGFELTITNTTSINNDEFLLGSVVNFGDGSDDVMIPVGQSYTHTYSNMSTFNVCLTTFGYFNLYANYQNYSPSFYGCTDNKCVNITVDGMPCSAPGDPGFFRKKADLESEENSFAMAPNPANNQVNITIPSGTQKLVIYNAIGKKVKSIDFPTEGINVINLESFENGVYIVSVVRNDGKIANKKLVKQ